MKRSNLPKSFEALLQASDLPVLVDFWAEWCGPCRMVSPAIERIAAENKGRLLTVKVNIDKKPHLAARYGIQSIPTILLFRRGEPVMRLTGAHPYEQLAAQVREAL
ncbi:thioredoxin [candidate division KSB1 bacterium]|nr:thioredoxin [candidate division KSB1 bacterium]